MGAICLCSFFALVCLTSLSNARVDCDMNGTDAKINCLLTIVNTMWTKHDDHQRNDGAMQEKMQEMQKEHEFLFGDTMARVTALQEENKRLRRIISNAVTKRQATEDAGVTYIRWGRTTCPGNISFTQMVYFGYAGGSHYTQEGGGSNYLCLPRDPEWNRYSGDVYKYSANVWGAEYQGISHIHEDPIKNHDVPCAVCLAKRSSILMIPGKVTCPVGWSREYYGYLMADYYKRTEFVCMDQTPELIAGGEGDQNGALFYYAAAMCGSLLCPPYVNGRQLTCVVCTK